MKVMRGNYIDNEGWQINLLPNISIMKSYRGITIIFDWLIWWFEIYTEKND